MADMPLEHCGRQWNRQSRAQERNVPGDTKIRPIEMEKKRHGMGMSRGPRIKL